ncbi:MULTISPECIES: rod shape-determining protein MreC [Enterococcus]|uniref:Cell shape-determining protein MreC n=1 Tax=Enterococcus lemanii TaxID=1159752 RepID=A0ABV9MZF2_9ENTE|nr:rod shape-determining protein MreC [Enterococcus faecium]MBD9903002.1 rod shape-determining protein MreC [Enterococcus faecium]
MKKFNPNKNIIITLILTILVVTILSVSIARRSVAQKTSFTQTVVNDTVAIVDRMIALPIRWVTNGAYAIENLFVTYEENAILKAKIDQYDAIVQQNLNQEREIAALQEELDLQATLTNYEKITSNVISRSPDTWQDMLIIDRGTRDGVEVNMAVLSNKGLVGRVIEANVASSKVELLTSSNQNSNQFPVRISGKKGETFGIIKQYDTEKKVLVVEQLTGAFVEENAVVQTSGLGGNSPADLPVGVTLAETTDRFGLTRQVYVKPYAQMSDLSVVTVIKRTVGDVEE